MHHGVSLSFVDDPFARFVDACAADRHRDLKIVNPAVDERYKSPGALFTSRCYYIDAARDRRRTVTQLNSNHASRVRAILIPLQYSPLLLHRASSLNGFSSALPCFDLAGQRPRTTIPLTVRRSHPPPAARG